MICISLSLYLLNGESKEFKQILLKEWDLLYSAITANADYFWGILNNLHTISKDIAKITYLEHLGLYISSENFAIAESYLYGFAQLIFQSSCRSFYGVACFRRYPIVQTARFGLQALYLDDCARYALFQVSRVPRVRAV